MKKKCPLEKGGGASLLRQTPSTSCPHQQEPRPPGSPTPLQQAPPQECPLSKSQSARVPRPGHRSLPPVRPKRLGTIDFGTV